MEQVEKRSYEIGFMARDEKGLAAVLDRVKAHGGEITLEGPVDEVALAYEIKKQKQARFGYLHASLDPSEIAVLNQELERAESILRFLIMTPPFIKPAPRQMPDGRSAHAGGSAASSSPAPFSSVGGISRRAGDARYSGSGDVATPTTGRQPLPPAPLSNEALEKKIEEILKEA